jgi:hypothetical protein
VVQRDAYNSRLGGQAFLGHGHDAGAGGQVRITLLEYDSNAYSLDVQTTLPAFPATSLPNPKVCQPPGELELNADDAQAVTDRDGSDLVYLLGLVGCLARSLPGLL